MLTNEENARAIVESVLDELLDRLPLDVNVDTDHWARYAMDKLIEAKLIAEDTDDH